MENWTGLLFDPQGISDAMFLMIFGSDKISSHEVKWLIPTEQNE